MRFPTALPRCRVGPVGAYVRERGNREPCGTKTHETLFCFPRLLTLIQPPPTWDQSLCAFFALPCVPSRPPACARLPAGRYINFGPGIDNAPKTIQYECVHPPPTAIRSRPLAQCAGTEPAPAARPLL